MSFRLENIIIDRIKKEGPIPFEKFMGTALYYPELGYYSRPDAAIGRKGDFYTSPHLSSIYGAMIGRQLIEMWEAMGKPLEFYAIEMGAGAGFMAKDILDYFAGKRHEIRSSLKYMLIEPFEKFREMQGEALAEHHEKAKWLTSLNDVPPKIMGCIFSNELLDAFPVHVVEMDSSLKEICVDHIDGRFTEIKREAGDELKEYAKDFIPKMPQGYRTEINRKIKDWVFEASSKLSEGFLLTIDYGHSAEEYYSQERSRGTLLCYHQHRVNENPYENIGEQDITAHVNFSSLKKWGEEVGLKTLGYTSQGAYLVSAGIDEVITELYAGSTDYESAVHKIKGLIMPEGMGESHMVMIQYKGEGNPQLRGFSLRNHVEKL
ncbi:MAG: SAM-dependent methyltransferase [Nitrospirae bacterium]|nr:SAM-dependent methyltransferase [Nitrospirota bacterium]